MADWRTEVEGIVTAYEARAEWETDSPAGQMTLEEAVAAVQKTGIKPTLIDRAVKRVKLGMVATVEGKNRWVVGGSRKLGDTFGAYPIGLQSNGHYTCMCYTHTGGGFRSRRLCSHVVAVILARKMGLVKEAAAAIEPVEASEPTPDEEPLDYDGEIASVAFTDGLTPADLGFDGEKFPTFRPQQITALRRILDSDAKVVIVQAPTGVGKTLIAAALSRLTGEQVIYCATTKQLQDQALADFSHLADGSPFGATLKGRANYPTQLHPFPEVNAGLCLATKTNGHCRWCCSEDLRFVETSDGHFNEVCSRKREGYCSYRIAKAKASRAPFVILNTSMFLNISQFAGMFKHNQLLVLDEADELESELMSFVELRIPKAWAKKLNLDPPEKVTVQEAWVEWVKERALPTAKARLTELRDSEYTEDLREENELDRIVGRMTGFLDSIEQDKWVWLPEEWVFKPVKVDRQGGGYLWSKAEKTVLLSATMLSADQVCKDLGINRADAEFVDLPSDFPPARRPVYYQPAASMTHKTKESAWPVVVNAMDGILDRHVGHKVLVHTVSYALAQYVMDNSRHHGRMRTYRTARERVDVLNDFKRSMLPLVLVAPSMERGVDLPADECRAVIVLKLPFPNLGDRQVSARLYGDKRNGSAWYALQTIRALVQMTGRGMRFQEDWALSYILDEQLERLWKGWKHVFPPWFKEAIIWPKKKGGGK